MSKKQLGSASGEEGGPEAPKRLGWFGRLRAQPGFRTATVAFVLTVVLGIGSTAAYAYWSQKNTVTQTVTTVRQDLPAISAGAKCVSGRKAQVNIENDMVPAKLLPEGASILVSVAVPGKGEKRYVVPNDGRFALRELPDLSQYLGRSARELSVSVTTAYVSSVPTNLPAPVAASQIGTTPPPATPGRAAEASWNGEVFRC